MATILEIRENALCVISARKSGNKVLVKNTFKIHSATSFIDKGKFAITEANIKSIKEAFNRYHITDRKLDVVVNYRSGITRDLVVPKMDLRKTRLIIENEMSNIYNLNKNYVIDYRDLHSSRKRTDGKLHVLVTALSQDFISSLEYGLSQCKLKIKSIDLSQSSFLKFVETYKVIEKELPTIVVELGETYVRSYLFDTHELKLMRTIYFYEEENFSTVMERLYQVVDLLDQAYFGETGRSVKELIVLGSDLYVPQIQQHYRSQEDFQVKIMDASLFAKGKKHAATEYLSSLGVLV